MSVIPKFRPKDVELTLPETNSSPLKIDPWKKEIPVGNHNFLGATLVLGSVYRQQKQSSSGMGMPGCATLNP